MAIRLASLLLALVSAACDGASSPAGPELVVDRYDFTRLDEAIQATVDTSRAVGGAAIVLVQGGDLVHAKGFGDLTPDSEVPIASGSKWLAAATVLALVGEGVLGLDEPIGRHLEPAGLAAAHDPAIDAVTPRQLLSQTAGFYSGNTCVGLEAFTLQGCASLVVATGLWRPPGTAFVYGSAGWQVAGAVAEVAARRSWAEIFQREIAGPLGLERTRFGTGRRNPALAHGATSTAREYARFVEMLAAGGVHRGRRVLPEALVAEMERDQTAGTETLYSPRPPTIRYGLGCWRDAIGPGGEALAVTSPGASGFFPWIDHRRDLVGVLYVPPSLETNAGTFNRALELVREIVPETAHAAVTAARPDEEPER